MILRLLILSLVVVLAWGVVWISERWRGRARTGLEPGLLLVTGEGCTLCGPAVAALESAGRQYRTVDASAVPHLGVRSVPTLLLVGGDGHVVARRSGRAAVMSPAQLAGWS